MIGEAPQFCSSAPVIAHAHSASASADPQRILYAAGISPNDSSLYRMWALQRLGAKVIPLNAYEYMPRIRCWRR